MTKVKAVKKAAAGTVKQPTQGRLVMDYMRTRGAITQASASAVLGISRLAAVIDKLKSQGTAISTTYQTGFKGRYAEYSIAQNN